MVSKYHSPLKGIRLFGEMDDPGLEQRNYKMSLEYPYIVPASIEAHILKKHVMSKGQKNCFKGLYWPNSAQFLYKNE